MNSATVNILHRPSYQHAHTFLFCIYLRGELLGHQVCSHVPTKCNYRILRNSLVDTVNTFPKQLCQFIFSPAAYENSTNAVLLISSLFLAIQHGLWDLSFLTHTFGSGGKAQRPNHWTTREFPIFLFISGFITLWTENALYLIFCL